jgi:putative NIF3 family GTP cyclohydrolase 1 type 2
MMGTPAPELDPATAALALEEKVDERVIDAVVDALLSHTPAGYRIISALYNNRDFSMLMQHAIQQQVNQALASQRSYWSDNRTY